MEQIGTITAVDGRTTGVDETGRTRVLRDGDPVYRDETLIAALDATATVRLHCGSVLHLGPGRLAVLDSDVFETDDAADDGPLRLEDVRRVLNWICGAARRSVA